MKGFIFFLFLFLAISFVNGDFASNETLCGEKEMMDFENCILVKKIVSFFGMKTKLCFWYKI